MSENNNYETNEFILFLKVFYSLLENCPSQKVLNSRIDDIKIELIKTANNFNAHAEQL